MPLDGHSLLVAQGWAGSGSGLREGAISRPLAIPQKRTLAGIGKDRDEAFPFWDHLFSLAAKSIKLKVYNSDSEEDLDADDGQDKSNSTTEFSRTSTGILSNRRPVVSAKSSGDSTPVGADPSQPKYSLLVTAKREAAKRSLYSMFFRGPILGPDFGHGEEALGASSTTGLPDEGRAKSGFAPSPDIEDFNEDSTAKKNKRKRDVVEVAIDRLKKKKREKNRKRKEAEEGEGERGSTERSQNQDEPAKHRKRDAKGKNKMKVTGVRFSGAPTDISEEEHKGSKEIPQASFGRDEECNIRQSELEKRSNNLQEAATLVPRRKKKRKRKD